MQPLMEPNHFKPRTEPEVEGVAQNDLAPLSFSSSGVIDFTVPQVPTGMKIGVCTTP